MAGGATSGATISGRYELRDRLGSGGMSSVYRAIDHVLERTVAVKILAEHLSDDEKFIARFRREALAVARLIHPNIVQVYDTGVDEGRHYIVMEYVEGRSGAQLLHSRGRLGPEVSVEIGVQSCAGLDYAHKQEIIHRDVKPGNLMVIGGPAGRRTAAYLSPELARGGEPAPAADVYALGVVVYQLLTARLPWEGTTLAELAMRRESEVPLAPTTYDPDVPDTLSGAVLRALAPDPAERYSTARELAGALRAGLAGMTPPPATGEAPTARLADRTAPTRLLGGDEAAAPEAVEPAPPRPAPARARPAPAPAPAAPPRRRAGGVRALRLLGLVLVILVLAAVIATIVLLTTNAGQNTNIGQFIKHNVPDQVKSLFDFISSHAQ